MAKLPEGRSTLTDEQMIGLTHRLVDTCIDCKARIEELEADLLRAKISEVFWLDGWHALDQDKRELEAKLAKAVELALEECPFRCGTPDYDNWWRDYRSTLAELTGGKDA